MESASVNAADPSTFPCRICGKMAWEHVERRGVLWCETPKPDQTAMDPYPSFDPEVP